VFRKNRKSASKHVDNLHGKVHSTRARVHADPQST
jgi:hypothetical protein